MRNTLKKTKTILTTLLFIAIISCQNEELELENKKLTENLEFLSLEKGIAEISNSEIKSELNSYLKIDENLEIEKYVFRDYTNYSLSIKKYSDSIPYYLSLIITRENNMEKACYVKYSPDYGSEYEKITKFSGTMELFDLQMNAYGKAKLVGGKIIQEGAQQRIDSYTECTTTVFEAEIPCSNGGNHGVGEVCGPGYSNDAHLSFSVSTVCYERYTYNGPDNFTGGTGGGGEVSLQNSFL